jgi:hypothetical protein
VGATPCHPRNVSLVGREYPAKTIGVAVAIFLVARGTRPKAGSYF